MAKIINPSKLLPPPKSSIIKSSTSIKIRKSNILSKTTSLSKGLLATKQSNDVIDVNNKLIKIDKFLKSDLIISQKKAEVKRKGKEKQDFDEAEKKLEIPKLKGFKIPSLGLPSLGFFDRVKRFLFFTALGWLLPKIIEFLPKLEGFAKIVGGIYNFAEGLFGNLFNGFMSLVKFGGDLKDKTIGFIASAKAGVGGNYQKEFEKLEKQFNTFANASIIAGLVGLDMGLAGLDEYNKWKRKNEGAAGTGGRKLAAEFLERKLGRKLNTQELKELGLKPGSIESRAVQRPGTQAERAAAKQQKRIQGAQLRLGAKKPKPKPSLWEKLTGGLKRKFSGVAGKLAKPFSKFAGAAIPGLGAAIGFADASARSKSGDKLGAFLAGLSASLDVFTAAVAVAGLASAATGVGLPAAAVLATAATAAGAISMSIDVVLLIRDILKAFGVPAFNKGGKVVRRYQGGGTTRGGRPVGGPRRRAITPTRKKPPRITLPKTQPGKDVGGEKKVKEFYAKPEDPNKKYTAPAGGWLANLGKERQDLSAFDTLKKMSGTLKSDETLAKGILGVMSSGIDMALGQKPDKKVFKSFFDSIGYIADTLASQRASKSMSSLRSQIGAFAEGGTIPSRGLRGTYSDANTGDMLAKLIGPTIDQRVNEAIQSIEKQLQMKGAGGAGGGPPGAAPGAPGDGGGGGGQMPGSAPPEVKAMLEAIAGAEGGWDSVNPSTTVPGLKNMTIAEARLAAIQKGIGEKGGSGAMGKFQQMPDYILERARDSGLDPYKDKFNEENQTKIARMLMASVYPGGEAQLIKDAQKDPLVAASKLRGTWPSLPGGTQENVHTRGFLDRYNRSVEKYRNTKSTEAQVTGGMKPSEIPLTSGQGPRWGKMHNGIDLDGGDGSPISSAQNAEVVFAGDNGDDYGNTVVLRYSNGAETRFAHLKSVNVRMGQKIKAGQLLGKQGSTGSATESHLHFEYFPSGGAMSYKGHGDAYSVKDSYFRYGGNVQAKVAEKPLDNPPKPGQQPPQVSNPNIINASGLALGNLPERIKNLKPGQKIVFNNIGSVQSGKNWLGQSEVKFYDTKGENIGRDKFNELLRNSEVLKQMKSNNLKVQNMQGGGLVSPSKPNRAIPNSFASYETPGGGMMTAIQPVFIIERKVPVSSENKIAFPVPVAVNSNMDLSLSRG